MRHKRKLGNEQAVLRGEQTLFEAGKVAGSATHKQGNTG